MAPTLSHQGCSTADQGPGLGPSYLQSGLGGTGIAHHGNSRANVNNVLARNNYVATDRPKLLVTTHRRENLGSAMENIGAALAELAAARPELLILLPAHRNPLVREAVLPRVSEFDNVLVTEPLSYGEFTTVMAASDVVLTDSGGIQEEAPSLGKPVLVMRENTERPEAVTAGSVALVGTDRSAIVAEVSRLF